MSIEQNPGNVKITQANYVTKVLSLALFLSFFFITSRIVEEIAKHAHTHRLI